MSQHESDHGPESTDSDPQPYLPPKNVDGSPKPPVLLYVVVPLLFFVFLSGVASWALFSSTPPPVKTDEINNVQQEILDFDDDRGGEIERYDEFDEMQESSSPSPAT